MLRARLLDRSRGGTWRTGTALDIADWVKRRPLGRLSTDADRRRVVEAMTHTQGTGVSNDQLGSVLKMLAPRWFVLRDLHRPEELGLLQSRTTLCWLKGPMTREDLRRLG